MTRLRLTRLRLIAPLMVALSVTAPALAADVHPIRFAHGRVSATVTGAVVRADRDTYRVGARAGQTMVVTIKALEDNAVFTIYAPQSFGGNAIAGDSADITHWSGKLPATGDYLIVVGGTRGNATYRMTVAVR